MNEVNEGIIAALPVVIILAFLSGAMIFLATYVHFPKMEEKQRLEISLKNAAYTVITLLLLTLLFLAIMLNVVERN